MHTKPQFHGSDIEAAADWFHIPKEDIVCFSANVNPLGLSERVKQDIRENLDVLSSYPDRNYTALKEVIGSYCGADPSHVIVGNGSTEMISLLIQSRRPRRALVVGPTYSEYEREISLSGGTLEYYLLREDRDFRPDMEDFCALLRTGYDLVILCNPNNPTSSALTANEIRQILDTLKETGGFLMIDETYVEFAPDVAKISAVPLTASYENLMVLRGVSKFFAAPGLRFGYGITGNDRLLADLARLQNPWSLNSLAAFAGERMLQDNHYIEETWNLVQTERTRMCNYLNRFDCLKLYPAYANFILVRLKKPGLTSAHVFDKLMQQGLMIRDCSTFDGLKGEYIRFCIMHPAQNTRLLEALRQILE